MTPDAALKIYDDAIAVHDPAVAPEERRLKAMGAILAALEARNAELVAIEAYAREATAAITGLTFGGSEYFGKRIGDMYTADLAFCVAEIRRRMCAATEEKLEWFRHKKAIETQNDELRAELKAEQDRNDKLGEELAERHDIVLTSGVADIARLIENHDVFDCPEGMSYSVAAERIAADIVAQFARAALAPSTTSGDGR